MTATGNLAENRKELSLHDRLALISLIEEGLKEGSSDSPIVADLFSNLWQLVGQTVQGAKLDHLKPNSRNAFQVLEIKAETGDILGRLNMLYLNKPMPCYYLVYVEVLAPFRNQGLGKRILEKFRDFLDDKSAVGILDNIIPKEDPTYLIYFKQCWRQMEEITGLPTHGDYMIYVPPRLQDKDLKAPVLKLVHHLKRRRPAIDMRDNEQMVRQTLDEFKDLYNALITYFANELDQGRSPGLMRFMFTRYVTKLISFRRRIRDLIGYTGGQAVDQIVLDSRVLMLPVQSYAPSGLASPMLIENGDAGAAPPLPQRIMDDPANAIEVLPNYRRPRLMTWLREHDLSPYAPLTIGQMMELGFDPTRLKEISIQGEPHIFQRMQIRQLPEQAHRKHLLKEADHLMAGAKAMGTDIRINAPILTIRDSGNAYVLRKKIPGIHWEEAVEQLHINEQLKQINENTKLDRIIKSTVNASITIAAKKLGVDQNHIKDNIVFFVSWDLDKNQPRIVADFASTYLEAIWLA